MLIQKKVKKDELFNGLIGKVNATKQDDTRLASFLKSKFIEDADIEPSRWGFSVYMYVSDEDDDYIIRIGEKSKDKICFEIRKDGKHLDEIKGLRLNNQKILEAIRTLFRKHVD